MHAFEGGTGSGADRGRLSMQLRRCGFHGEVSGSIVKMRACCASYICCLCALVHGGDSCPKWGRFTFALAVEHAPICTSLGLVIHVHSRSLRPSHLVLQLHQTRGDFLASCNPCMPVTASDILIHDSCIDHLDCPSNTAMWGSPRPMEIRVSGLQDLRTKAQLAVKDTILWTVGWLFGLSHYCLLPSTSEK
jgi:hypothetical protein